MLKPEAFPDAQYGMAVVVMSGHTEDAVLREGVRDGGLGFVQKPFSESSLLQAVAVALAPEGID